MHKTRKRHKRLRKTTRVTVDMPTEKHKRLKAVAALNGETLQAFILTCVEEKIEESPNKTKMEKLEELGLIGFINEHKVTSTNYREHIKKKLKEKYEE